MLLVQDHYLTTTVESNGGKQGNNVKIKSLKVLELGTPSIESSFTTS